jgi:hypothetical protein
MSGVIIVNTLGHEGRWVFEQLARDGRLAVIMEHPNDAIHVALKTGGLVGFETPDPSRLVDGVAGQLAPVAVIVLTADEDSEVPGTPHRWISLDRPGALKRLHGVLERHLSEAGSNVARPILRR